MMAAIYPAPLDVERRFGSRALRTLRNVKTRKLSGVRPNVFDSLIALVADAELLVLDEPTVHGRRGSSGFLERHARLRRSSKTVIFARTISRRPTPTPIASC